MYPDSEGYANQGMQRAGASLSEKLARPATPRERAQMAVNAAEARLSDAKRVMEIFDQHPELEELLMLLSRQGNF